MAPGFDPKKILIVLHGSIGDVTRALPLATLVRAGFPRAHLAWAVEQPSLPLVQNYPGVDEVILFERRRWWAGIGPFLKRIRSGRFDLVLDLQRILKSGAISRWSGAPYRIGFNRHDCKEFNWLFNNHRIPPCGDAIAKLDHYLKFAEYLGLSPRAPQWSFALSAAENAAVDAHLAGIGGRFAVLFAGSRWESKRWFAAQIGACARVIHERHGLGVVLLGGEEDRQTAEAALSGAGSAATNLVGRTSLREAIGVIARAKVAVGPDTGLMHIAAALGTPVVSLWGATSPARTGPYGFADLVIQGRAACAPCYRRRCAIGRICMQSISVEEIAGKIDLALARRS